MDPILCADFAVRLIHVKNLRVPLTADGGLRGLGFELIVRLYAVLMAATHPGTFDPTKWGKVLSLHCYGDSVVKDLLYRKSTIVIPAAVAPTKRPPTTSDTKCEVAKTNPIITAPIAAPMRILARG